MDTSEIVKLLLKKDERGLSYLFDNYAAALNGIICRILLSEKLSEEILEDTFLKIWAQIDSYDPDKSSLFTWMSRIARNSAIDTKRLQKFENSRKTDSLDLRIHDIGSETQNINAIDTDTLLSKIDPKYSSVLEHIYLHGYSHREASEILDLPLGTVKTRLRNGLKKIRDLINTEKGLFLSLILLLSSILLIG